MIIFTYTLANKCVIIVLAAFVALSAPPLSGEAPKFNLRLPFVQKWRFSWVNPLFCNTSDSSPREWSANMPSAVAESRANPITSLPALMRRFAAHRVRYQDAPAICSIRLRREFAIQGHHPPSTTFSVTDAELADYNEAHTPKTKRGQPAREDENF
jgi:hypothetical protein